MEGRALWRGGVVLLLLALVRLAVDEVRSGPDPLRPSPSVLPDLIAQSEAERAQEERRSRPMAAGETLDPNRSEEEELDRLPGVGPATARAIVEEREDGGPFRGAQDLLRVRGIGPATLEKILPWIDLAEGVPLEAGRSERTARTRASPEEPTRLPGLAESQRLVNVNTASVAELESLPGIGPALADRIIQSRETEGRFSSAEDLLRVRGIGPVVLDRIRMLVRTGG